jgi:glycosyltransferase involved in cell wall biosynthesis
MHRHTGTTTTKSLKRKKKMKLSILTPTIPNRESQLKALSEKLAKQIGDLPVEHLILSDNRKRSIGEKRQSLVDIANGEYIAFCDDDDNVSDNYVSALLQAIETKADVITFNQKAIYNGLESEVHFGIRNQDSQFNPGGITLRGPWHVCAWNRQKVKGCVFGFSNYGEDLVWSHQARKRIKTGHHIYKVLHTYIHDAATTAAPEL